MANQDRQNSGQVLNIALQNPSRVLKEHLPVIGVFDSGLGGLSVLGALAELCPFTDLIYAADTAYVPYGNKSPEEIRRRVLSMGQALIREGCTTLVVACNTATAEAIEALRSAYPHIPVVGVEPGIKPAALQTKTGQIAVLATVATAKSQRLAQLITRYAPQHKVHIIPCHGWANEVEALNLAAPIIITEVQHTLLPLIEQGVDQVVLGCTHYDFLAPTLHHLVGHRAQLVRVAEAVARQTAQVAGPSTTQYKAGPIRLMATAHPERLLHATAILPLTTISHRITGVETLHTN